MGSRAASDNLIECGSAITVALTVAEASSLAGWHDTVDRRLLLKLS